MVLTLMGTGTSHGVPVIGCNCKVCTSTNIKDKRLRSSAYITQQNPRTHDTTRILIDVGPDFRTQALTTKIPALDAILITHGHADHLHGLDDIRIFSHTKLETLHKNLADNSTKGEGIPVYANRETLETIQLHFDYIFQETQIGGGKPKIKLINAENFTPTNPLTIGSVKIISIPMKHGNLDSMGYLLSCIGKDGALHSVAYLTDANFISDESACIIKENAGILDHVIIDGLRIEKHSTHFSFLESLAFAEKLAPFHTWLIHITHDSNYVEICDYITKNLHKFPTLLKIVKDGGTVLPSYDGLVLPIGE